MHRATLKTLLLITLLSVFAGCSAYVPAGGVAVRTEARLDLFYDQLAPFGDWIRIDAYGWVWVPAAMPSQWHPYTQGRWVYTTAGWTWYSDWDWGWIPFHYGRWHHHGRHGWVWIPGRVWGPGWVAWRSGEGWMGWAPLPPESRWRIGIGLDLGGVDLHLGISSGYWSFVKAGYLTSPEMHRHVAPRQRNSDLLHGTRDITRYFENHRGVVERGVDIQIIERAQGRAITKYRVEDLKKPPNGGDGRLGQGVYKTYRPKVGDPAPHRATPRGKGKKKGNRN